MSVGTVSRSFLVASTAVFAVSVLTSSVARSARPAGKTQQGWTADDQKSWYRGSQGSRLVPLSWLKAVEEAGSAAPLMSAANVARYGYLPMQPDDGLELPIGFAKDVTRDADLTFTNFRWFKAQPDGEPWVGMNCAACHTAEIDFEGKPIVVDGGPTMADFQTFTSELDDALARTEADPAKFDRFASRVLPNGSDAGDRAMLRSALAKFNAHQKALRALNGTEPEFGNGRLDAVGHILNKIAYLTGAPSQFGGTADAPVSYPFLWNINQHDLVQWDGIAPNKGSRLLSGETFDAGALVRNTSEVIGVFADVDVEPNPTVNGYRSSVNVMNLDAMEVQVGRLMAPAWPGSLKPGLVQRGRQVFIDRKCSDCHTIMDRTDLKAPIKAAMEPVFGPGAVGTDPWMACNTFTYQAASGNLKGIQKAYLFGTAKFKDVDFTRDMLVATSVGTLFGKKRQITETVAKAAFGLPRKIQPSPVLSAAVGQKSKEERLRDCVANKGEDLMRYKGRPLNGIWATAPYLHNGSVRTLYQLLLPPSQRESEFWVGNRDFDAKEVGFRNIKGMRGRMLHTMNGDVPVPGNSKEGHDYGNANIPDSDRWALVEYMKSL